ncbi:MAG TPA: type I methionyl aminopeptidase [Candidatus Omnitrophota bacterium]|nr:type I methionyl aminopeptidase [Candidatus Omnitrophota bacterium]HNQ51370.1 type I methionyl aminopeptidase [Candidatus Omnitrophota bacterium]HQO38036.1 type I methionyl aminopeptidase [Candidatus Omnitrophota bacterium]
MIPVKSPQDLAVMRSAGKILADILRAVQQAIKAGVTTGELDRCAARLMESAKVESAFLGYRGYPGTVCVSINDEVVHGIPGSRLIREGDIVSLDMGIRYKGFYSDAAVTVPVGNAPPDAKRLIDVTRKSLSAGIRQMRAGNRLSDISHAIQQCAEQAGYGVVRQFVGHGIGVALHEDPEIPNFGMKGRGPVLTEGMVFAIEPMINQGTWECEVLDDGWTAVTADGKLSAHWEHTVALTEKGAEILTLCA